MSKKKGTKNIIYSDNNITNLIRESRLHLHPQVDIYFGRKMSRFCEMWNKRLKLYSYTKRMVFLEYLDLARYESENNFWTIKIIM